MKTSLFFIILSFLLINCVSDKTPLKPERLRKGICDSIPYNNPCIDTSYISRSNYKYSDNDSIEVVPGVFIICKGVTGDYRVGEKISGRVILKNVSCNTTFRGMARGYPYYYYFVEEMSEELICFSPGATDPVLVHYNLDVGDSVYQDFAWYHSTYSGLYAYARSYNMYLSFDGHDSLYTHYIRKQINILPEGDRFSCRVYRNYYYKDCYVYDFFLRNRFPDDTTIVLIHPNTVIMEWYRSYPDSLLKTQYFEFSEYFLPLKGFSTWRYRRLIDFNSPDLRGLNQDLYKVRFILKVDGRNFEDIVTIWR
jgi:hypothetical protein